MWERITLRWDTIRHVLRFQALVDAEKNGER